MDKTELFLEIALKASSKASQYLKKEFGSLKKTEIINGRHYTIKDDIIASDIYIKILKKETPNIPLFTEESGNLVDTEWLWVVDPIEGTSNYRVGNPFFATQLCLLHNKIPVVSVINAPLLKQLFTAQVNKGAFCNNKKIRVSDIKDLSAALISIGKGNKQEHLDWYANTLPKFLPKVRTFRHYGAAGLEMAYTAAGKIDAYINWGSHPYDYLPGSLLISEAGGKMVLEDYPLNSQYKIFIGANASLFSSCEKIVKGNI
jgi:myo-inositol-1(or 4)-monophosphatase